MARVPAALLLGSLTLGGSLACSSADGTSGPGPDAAVDGGSGGGGGTPTGGATGGDTGGSAGGATGGAAGGQTGGSTGGATGGDTGGAGGEVSAPPVAPPIPFADCEGPRGGGLGGPEVPACEIHRDVACAPPCDLVDAVELRCDRRVGTWFGLRSDDTPWVVADPAAGGQSPVAWTLGDAPVSTPLVGVSVTRGYGLDAADTLHVLHTTEGPDAALLHRIAGGPDAPAACLQGPFTVFTPFGVVGAPGRPGALHVVAGAIHGEEQGLVVLTRSPEGAWSAEDLLVAASQGQLAVAGDGTPLVSVLTTETGAWGVWLRTADEWQRLPLDLGHVLDQVPVLVPAATGAAFVMAAAGFEVRFAIPGAEAAFGIAGLNLLDPSLDCVGQENDCDRVCSTKREGSPRLPAVVPDGEGFLLVRIHTTVDVDSHDEGSPCGEAGCFCEHVIDADRSTSALVVEHFDPVARTLTERWRMPVAMGTTRIEAARTQGGDLVLAWPGESGLRLERLPAVYLAGP